MNELPNPPTPSPLEKPQGYALCAEHPDQYAVGGCSRCGSFFCAACTGYAMDAERYCVRCDPGGDYVAWEDRKLHRVFTRFWNTLKSLLFRPDRFFQRVPLSGGLGRPLLFAWMSWALSIVSTTLAYGLMVGGMFLVMPEPAGGGAPTGPLLVAIFSGVGVGALVSIFAGIFVFAIALHLIAKIFGGTGTFQATFRVVCYASGAMAAGIIPFLGITLGEIYVPILAILGLRRAHSMGTASAVVAVLLIPAMCCGLYVVTVFGLAFAGAAGSPSP